MGLTGKYTTLAEILERVHRDYGFVDIYEDEAAEWVWDIVGKIGASEPYQEQQILIDIEDYRGFLPLDLYSVEAIRDRTTFIELRPTVDKYYFSDYKLEDQSATTIATGDVDPVTGVEYETVVPSAEVPEYYTYKLQGGYIYTGFSTGRVEMIYKAFPVDIHSGLPKIPDDPKYIEAVVTFIASKLAFRLMLQDKLSEKLYDRIEQKALFASGAARNKALIPDPNKMETIKNIWLSPYPYHEHFETGNIHLGSRERNSG